MTYLTDEDWGVAREAERILEEGTRRLGLIWRNTDHEPAPRGRNLILIFTARVVGEFVNEPLQIFWGGIPDHENSSRDPMRNYKGVPQFWAYVEELKLPITIDEGSK